MQFLLTEGEYNEFNAQKRGQNAAGDAELQRLCTLAANHIPVQLPWDDEKKASPWGCILDEKTNPGYCDHCPVDFICEYDRKEWSQQGVTGK